MQEIDIYEKFAGASSEAARPSPVSDYSRKKEHMTTYTGQEYENKICECVFHRYNQVHICTCGELISHSQADFDAHRLHAGFINIEAIHYNHGDTASILFDRMQGYGLLPYGTPEFEKVYNVLDS